LRHSVVLQVNPTFNVVGYNYSDDEYAPDCFLDHSNCLGDFVFHGRFNTSGAQHNLVEGNYFQWFRFDKEHSNNGPYNVLFRNKSYLGLTISTESDDQYRQAIIGFDGDYFEPWTIPEASINDIKNTICARYWDTNDGKEYDGSASNLSNSEISLYKDFKPDFINQWPYSFVDLPAESRYNNLTDKTVPVNWNGYLSKPLTSRLRYLDDGRVDNSTELYEAWGTIYSGPYTAESSADVKFIAGASIELLPGFTIIPGAKFEASINPSLPSSHRIKTQNNVTQSHYEDFPTKKIEKSPALLVYPNPAKNIINFSLTGPTDNLILIEIYDVTGNLIKKINNINSSSYQIDLSTVFSSGLYFIRSTTESGQNFTKKVIVNKD